jgi:hypothetical protein
LEKNYAYMGGGVYGVKSGLIIQKSMFKHNDAGYGGAMQAFGVDIQGTDFISNTCGNSGGALGSGGSVNITGSRFLNNTAGFSGGGAIWGSMNLSVVNSLFAGNHADNLASVLELQGNQARTLEHVTIASASLDSQPAIDLPAGTLGITNTILTNFNMGIAMLGGTLNADYNLFYGNTNNVVSIGGILHWGFHNLSGNPLFINPAISDYHLQAGSIAINQGINLGIPTDLDGKPRDAKPDIGAYEYWSYVYQPVVRK